MSCPDPFGEVATQWRYGANLRPVPVCSQDEEAAAADEQRGLTLAELPLVTTVENMAGGRWVGEKSGRDRSAH